MIPTKPIDPFNLFVLGQKKAEDEATIIQLNRDPS